MQYFDMNNPAVHNYISQMADEVHFYGSKLILVHRPEVSQGLLSERRPRPRIPRHAP